MVSCKSEGSHVSVLASTVNETDDDNDLFNDNADPDPDNAVDVLWDPEPIVSNEDMALCLYCAMHESCSDNEVPGANLTIFDTCTDRGCCSIDESQKSIHGQSLSDNAQYRSASYLAESGDDNNGACSDCVNFNMCMSPGMPYDICFSMGCCNENNTSTTQNNGHVPPLN